MRIIFYNLIFIYLYDLLLLLWLISLKSLYIFSFFNIIVHANCLAYLRFYRSIYFRQLYWGLHFRGLRNYFIKWGSFFLKAGYLLNWSICSSISFIHWITFTTINCLVGHLRLSIILVKMRVIRFYLLLLRYTWVI